MTVTARLPVMYLEEFLCFLLEKASCQWTDHRWSPTHAEKKSKPSVTIATDAILVSPLVSLLLASSILSGRRFLKHTLNVAALFILSRNYRWSTPCILAPRRGTDASPSGVYFLINRPWFNFCKMSSFVVIETFSWLLPTSGDCVSDPYWIDKLFPALVLFGLLH